MDDEPGPGVDVDGWLDRWQRHVEATVSRWARGIGPPVYPGVYTAVTDALLDRWRERMAAEQTPLPTPLIALSVPGDIAELDK